MPKYNVIVSFGGAVDFDVEAVTEEEAKRKIEDGLADGSIKITDEQFSENAEIEDVYCRFWISNRLGGGDEECE